MWSNHWFIRKICIRTTDGSLHYLISKTCSNYIKLLGRPRETVCHRVTSTGTTVTARRMRHLRQQAIHHKCKLQTRRCAITTSSFCQGRAATNCTHTSSQIHTTNQNRPLHNRITVCRYNYGEPRRAILDIRGRRHKGSRDVRIVERSLSAAVLTRGGASDHRNLSSLGPIHAPWYRGPSGRDEMRHKSLPMRENELTNSFVARFFVCCIRTECET